MIEKIYEISCDTCLTVLSHVYSMAQAKQILKESGWKTKDSKHYCPDCQ